MNKRLIKPLALLAGCTALLSITSCTKNDQDYIPGSEYKHGQLGRGAYFLSEGNFSDGTGSLHHMDHTGTVNDSIYFRTNGKRLGNVTQDLFLSGNKLYVISQNGVPKNNALEVEGQLYIFNNITNKRERVYSNEELSTLKNPTHIAVVGDRIYLRDSRGVYVLKQTAGATPVFVEGTQGALAQPMTVKGGRVYVATPSHLVVIQGDAVLESLPIADGKLISIAPGRGNTLWLATKDSHSFIKLDATTHEEQGRYPITEDLSSWSNSNKFFAKGDTLFYQKGSVVRRYIASTKQLEQEFINVKEMVPNTAQDYNALAVDAEAGILYFSGIHSWAKYRENNIAIYDIKGDKAELLKTIPNLTSFTAGIYPVSSLLGKY